MAIALVHRLRTSTLTGLLLLCFFKAKYKLLLSRQWRHKARAALLAAGLQIPLKTLPLRAGIHGNMSNVPGYLPGTKMPCASCLETI
jgi:hypothetical protein